MTTPARSCPGILSRALLSCVLVPCAVTLSLSAIAGCGAGDPASPAITGHQIQGSVHGGQQPVSGSVITLYAAGTSGYGIGAASLLTTSVVTGSDGSFTITGDYVCPSTSSQLYLVATGGNPGMASGTNNTALVLMAALGPCSLYGGSLTLNPNSFVSVNEVTTVAAAYSLSGFMDPVTTQIGAPLSNATGLANAFQTVNNLVNTSTGQALTLTASGGTVPQSEINSIADMLSPCVNSTGAGTPCSALFSAATPATGTAPANTLQAALSIALNPASKVTALFNLIPASPPFLPTASPAPSVLTMGITYPYPSTLVPTSMAVDLSGNIWVGLPSASGTALPLLVYSNTGAVLANPTGYTGAAIINPHLAFDPSGNLWVAAQYATGGGVLIEFTNGGAAATTFTTPNLTTPVALAFDALGEAWVENYNTTSSMFVFSPTGTLVSPTSGYTASSLMAGSNQGSIAFNDAGNAWVSGTTNTPITEFSPAGLVLSGTGFGPYYSTGTIAFDYLNNLWMASGNKLSPTGAAITISPFCVTNGAPGGCNSNIYALGIDGSGNAWGGENLFLSPNFYYGFVELNNTGSPVLSVLDRQLPQLISIDTSGNVWAVPGQVGHQVPAPLSITIELVGASTPVVIPSVGVQNHTVGMRP